MRAVCTLTALCEAPADQWCARQLLPPEAGACRQLAQSLPRSAEQPNLSADGVLAVLLHQAASSLQREADKLQRAALVLLQAVQTLCWAQHDLPEEEAPAHMPLAGVSAARVLSCMRAAYLAGRAHAAGPHHTSCETRSSRCLLRQQP